MSESNPIPPSDSFAAAPSETPSVPAPPRVEAPGEDKSADVLSEVVRLRERMDRIEAALLDTSEEGAPALKRYKCGGCSGEYEATAPMPLCSRCQFHRPAPKPPRGWAL